MNTIHKIILPAIFILILAACGKKENAFDATGTFEAEETIISAESQGVLLQFNLEEGQTLKTGDYLGYIDSTQLYLKKQQVMAQINAINSRKPNVSVQIAALEQQLKTLKSEQTRVQNLVKANAATTKAADDIQAQIDVVEKQLNAQKSSLQIAVNGINSENTPLQIQIEQLNDQLKKCQIICPQNGTVLLKYAEENEMMAPAKPLYKMADLSHLILRAYITGDQLSLVKLGQNIKILTDNGKGGMDEGSGTLTWINNKAEFTPKTIQTKNERANMVYAVKIKVKNSGNYKIGMYGEIKFQ